MVGESAKWWFSIKSPLFARKLGFLSKYKNIFAFCHFSRFVAPRGPSAPNLEIPMLFHILLGVPGPPGAIVARRQLWYEKKWKCKECGFLADFNFPSKILYFCGNLRLAETPIFPMEYWWFGGVVAINSPNFMKFMVFVEFPRIP